MASYARSAWNWACDKVRPVAKVGVGVGVGSALVSMAGAQTLPDSSTITTNITAVQTIWASVAAIIISVALVLVAVRFFRKLH